MSKGPEVDYQQIEKIDTSGIAHHVVKERERTFRLNREIQSTLRQAWKP